MKKIKKVLRSLLSFGMNRASHKNLKNIQLRLFQISLKKWGGGVIQHSERGGVPYFCPPSPCQEYAAYLCPQIISPWVRKCRYPAFAKNVLCIR